MLVLINNGKQLLKENKKQHFANIPSVLKDWI